MAAKRQKLTNDELYRRYSRDYNKIQNRLYRQTKRRMFSEKMTKEQFLTFYSARKNDMEEYAENMGYEKPRSQSVIDSIISDQKYKLSIRQARVIKMSLDADHSGWDDDWPTRWVITPSGLAYQERINLTEENIRRGYFKKWIEDRWDQIQWWREQRRKELESTRRYSTRDINQILADEVVEVFNLSP